MTKELTFCNRATIEIPSEGAILCDLDGTLVDTDDANYLAYRLAVFEVTRGQIQLIYDEERVTRRRLKRLVPTLTDAQLKEIVLLKMNYFTQFLSVTRLNTMLASLIAEHSHKNDIVLLTCCRERRATAILEYYKLLKHFNKLICREVLSHNAASNRYETAIRITGMHRESIMVFDNDPSGVEAAVNAGIPEANVYKIISERENVYD